jgi:hypothetical protein
VFVRFKRVKLATRIGGMPTYSLHAVLVENFRENGKPRQRIVKYLCSMHEYKLKSSQNRQTFFKQINKKLEQADLDAVTLAKIKVKLIGFFVHKTRQRR